MAFEYHSLLKGNLRFNAIVELLRSDNDNFSGKILAVSKIYVKEQY